MADTSFRLKIIILDTDVTGGTLLKSILQNRQDVEEIVMCKTVAEAKKSLSQGSNSIFIDIFSLGPQDAIPFVEHTREKYPNVPICLFSQEKQLIEMPAVSNHWKERFGHYYRLPKDQTYDLLIVALERLIYKLIKYYQIRVARNKVSQLRDLTQKQEQNLTTEQKREIEETANVVEKALDIDSKHEQDFAIVPGVNTEQMEKLVSETLKEANLSLSLTTKVNIGVLVVGILLVIISFIVASITSKWEAVAFGGFGMAGIIASLIANPLRSIGARSRKLVQVQVAYLSFLSQLALLSRAVDNNDERIKISERLENAMAQTLRILSETE